MDKRFYSKEELVVEILDTAFEPHVYVFGGNGMDAKSVFEAKANKRSGSFVKAKTSGNRAEAEEVWVNAGAVKKIKYTKLPVPENIISKIDELNATEDSGRASELQDELNFYFNS